MFNYKYLYSILIFLIITTSCLAQGEGNNWYFGTYAGLTFNTNPPSLLNNGNLSTGEGCASVSDSDGNLMFYTDGSTVYGANHVLMPNGTGLHGNPSSTQSAVVCPKPGTYNYGLKRFDRYYIVTIDVYHLGRGVKYSEVDMTANGGLGEVVSTQKNIHLFGTLTMEGASVAKHANGCDYWIIGKQVGNNKINAYLITSSGVNLTPVISSAGPVVYKGWGSIKVSPDNKIIGIATGNNFNGGAPYTNVYDFDNSTGVVTHKFSDVVGGYSLEFSPNSKILYSMRLGNTNIYQYDLSLPNTSIVGSRTIIGTTSNTIGYKMCGLQLAPDGKIYAALQDAHRLGAIENPNVLGVGCTYNDNAIAISGLNTNGTAMNVRLGLPAFPSFFVSANNIIYESLNYNLNQYFCSSDSITFKVQDIEGVQTLDWYVSSVNTTSNSTPSSSDFEYKIPPLTNGDYKVLAVLNYACYIDTIIDTITVNNVPTVDLGLDSVLNCLQQTLDLNGVNSSVGSNFSYLWSTTDGNFISGTNSITASIDNDGVYYLKVTDSNKGCSALDSILVIVDTIIPVIDAGLDTVINCRNPSVILNGNNSQSGNFTYNWTTDNGNIVDGANMLNTTIDLEGIYYLNVVNNDNHCSTLDSLLVQIDTVHPVSMVGNDTLINCFNPEVQLSGIGSSTGNYEYLWTTMNGEILNGAMSLSPIVDAGGIYKLTVTNIQNGCSSSDQVIVTNDGDAFVEIINAGSSDSIISFFTFNDLSLNYNGNSGSVNWYVDGNDIGNDSVFQYVFEESGTHFVSIVLMNNENGCLAYDTMIVNTIHELEIPNAISPNSDGLNDLFVIRALENYEDNSLLIFNRWGNPVFESEPYENNWGGQTNVRNVLSGEDVVDGTYFYILKLVSTGGEELIYKGFIDVVRK